jgi:hypothetical protein
MLDNRSTQLINNSIYFFRYIRFDHTLDMMWGYDQQESFLKEGVTVQAIVNLQEISYQKLNSEVDYATQTLSKELAKVITS